MSDDCETKAAPRALAFVEDIFIARGSNAEPVIYRLLERDWKQLPAHSETELNIPEIANLMPLIRNEVVVADVPRLGEQEEFTFINLTALAVNKD